MYSYEAAISATMTTGDRKILSMDTTWSVRSYLLLGTALLIPCAESLSTTSSTISSRSASTLTFTDGFSSTKGLDCIMYQCATNSNLPAGGGAAFMKRSSLLMKVSPGGSRQRSSKSSELLEFNNLRIQTAGRRGTKKFIDPLKVFVGNLPFDATESDIAGIFAEHWSIPQDTVKERIESIKIIRDWKTGQSKGYGFMQFFDTMAATSAMKSINEGGGLKIKGRRIRLDQGKRKGVDDDEREKKNEKRRLMIEDLDDEGSAIHSALESVEGAKESIEENGLRMSEDDMITFMEKGGLRGVMPLTEEAAGYLGIQGLYEDDKEAYFAEYYNENGYNDEDFEGFDDDEDNGDENFVYDGVFDEIYNPDEYENLSPEEEQAIKVMNREQRRAADKKRKKRKLPFKGFGSPP